MENDVLDSSMSGSDLKLTSELKSYFNETAKWANFLAIVGFIGLGLMVVLSIFMMFAMGAVLTQASGLGGGLLGSVGIGVLYLLLALLYFFPTRFLYRFAKNMKLAEATGDHANYVEGFKNLKSFFKFIGIFTAIFVGIYLLIIVFALVMGGLASMF